MEAIVSLCKYATCNDGKKAWVWVSQSNGKNEAPAGTTLAEGQPQQHY